ncbi:MAG: hypothetical protein WAK54_26240 [Bradyrhizobium sp.]
MDAGFFAAASFATFLPSIGISISFWPLPLLRGFFDGFEAFAGWGDFSEPPRQRKTHSS